MLRPMSKDPRDPTRKKPSGTGRKPASERAPVSAVTDKRMELLELTLHDLQAPVAILDVSMRLLASDLAGADAEVQDTLRDARRAAGRIRQYIDHLIVSERLRHGTLELHRTPVDIASRLKELTDEYRGHAALVRATIDADLSAIYGMIIRADETLLVRVFQNLLENAVRHAEGGRVLVTASRDSVLEIRVQNDGPSIPASQQERVFQKFSSGVRNGRTSGLGLYFCRLALDAHSGTIVIEDDPAWPVTFVVRLPVSTL